MLGESRQSPGLSMIVAEAHSVGIVAKVPGAEASRTTHDVKIANS
jgi:hypothetical protein